MEPILELAHRYLHGVRASGPQNIVALCPFHDDSSPSFAMNILNGLYICYACGEKGGLETFLRRMGLPPQTISKRYGGLIEKARQAKPPAPNPIKPGVINNNPIPEDILGLFDLYPKELLDQGFTQETLDYFQIGFDKWHMRITYPLRDLNGNLVGISGRAIDEDNYPRYKVYQNEYAAWGLPPRRTEKRFLLWNAHNVYTQVYFSKVPSEVVLVEGYKACMWVYQAGFKDVLALQGSKMSWEQKWILQRLGARVLMMLDNDDAGWSGAAQIGEELSKSNPVGVVEYDAEQPDQLEPTGVLETINKARDYYKVWINPFDTGV